MTNEIKLNLSAADVQEVKRAIDMGLGLQIGLQLGANVTVSAGGVPDAIKSVIDGSSGNAVYFDTSDGSKMWQDSGETTPAANGSDVQRVNAAYGAGNLVQAIGAPTSTTYPDWDEANGLLDYPTRDGHVLGLAIASEAGKYLAMVLRHDDANNFISASCSGTINIGLAQNGSASATVTNTGTPTILVDGVTVTTRDQMFDAFSDGLPHVVEYRGLDLSSATEIAFGRINGENEGFNLAGALGHIVYADNPSSGDADAVREALQATYS